MTPPARQPNILLITSDQQRYDSCGPLAPPFMRTPHFDHLAREGVAFSRAYADCPLCVPSRVSIMTGRHVFTHGHPTNGPTAGVIDNRVSLPSRLRALGYQTAAIGKMHFGPQRARHGFDEMILPQDYYIAMRNAGHPWQPMRHGLGQNELYPSMATVPEAMTLTSWIAEQCVSYIKERRDPTAPFFLWCSFSKPHPPLDPPEPYYSMYRGCAIPAPVYGDWSSDSRAPEAFKRFRQSWSLDLIPPDIIREARAAYYGLITHIDYAMGRVLAALQDLGLFDEALILYTSDHGEYLGDHHSGAKTFFHEPSAHVPMALRLPKSWPDRRHGQTCASVVTLADILPTFVAAASGQDAADQPAPAADVDGQDLVALARGRLPRPRQFLVASAAPIDNPPSFGITDGRWKYIYWPEGAAEQLFDLAADPRELRDLAAEASHAAECRALRGQMEGWLRARGAGWLRDGQLPAFAIRDDSAADRRNSAWPGYHTESYDIDVRH
jgi:arylsulfatase A-like enzyme